MKVLLITIGIVASLYIAYKVYSISQVHSGLKAVIKKGAVILDVRTKTEFQTGHINGAVNIPLSRLHDPDIPLDPACTYITCCSHGLRSVKAVSLLKEKGFKNVFNGGAWSDLEETMLTTQPSP